MVAVNDATRDCRPNVLEAFFARAVHTATASARAVAETLSRKSETVTTSTRTPRRSLSSSDSPDTRSSSFPAPGTKSTRRSTSESSRASPRATDPNRRGLVAPYRSSSSATRSSCWARAVRSRNVASVGVFMLPGQRRIKNERSYRVPFHDHRPDGWDGTVRQRFVQVIA